MDNSEFINLYIENLTKMLNDTTGKLVLAETKIAINEKLAIRKEEQFDVQRSEMQERIQQLEDSLSRVQMDFELASKRIEDSNIIIHDLNRQLEENTKSKITKD